jgi:hypothetical protein
VRQNRGRKLRDQPDLETHLVFRYNPLQTEETKRMALIIGGKSTCSICDDLLGDGDDLVATTHFIADKTDPLWRYSDSAMHRICFLSWEHRLKFIEKYNETIGQIVLGNGTRHRMQLDGTIVLDRE